MSRSQVGNNTTCSRMHECYVSTASRFYITWLTWLETRMGIFLVTCPCWPYCYRQLMIIRFENMYSSILVVVTSWWCSWTCQRWVGWFRCNGLPGILLIIHQLLRWFWWNCRLAWSLGFGFGWILVIFHCSRSRNGRSRAVLTCRTTRRAMLPSLHRSPWSV